MAVATFVAAIVCALAVPISQLRTISIIVTCCCPDPAKCHCPDHRGDASAKPTMRACHKQRHESVAPQAPSFAAPELALAVAPPRAAVAVLAAPDEPHAPPILDELYGPS
jgi:hypothetical protein